MWTGTTGHSEAYVNRLSSVAAAAAPPPLHPPPRCLGRDVQVLGNGSQAQAVVVHGDGFRELIVGELAVGTLRHLLPAEMFSDGGLVDLEPPSKLSDRGAIQVRAHQLQHFSLDQPCLLLHWSGLDPVQRFINLLLRREVGR